MDELKWQNLVNPPIHPFSGLGGVEDLGDLQFVQDRIKAGEWFQVSGAINALNDTIEFIPVSGKTAVLFEAKIVTITDFPSTGAGTLDSKVVVEAQLKINTIVKDKTRVGTKMHTVSPTTINNEAASAGVGTFGDGKFNALGISLEGDGVKKIEIENIVDNGSAFATMSGWLFTT